MEYLFNSKVYKERRQLLAEKVGSGLVILLGNEAPPMDYPGQGYPFRQDASFLYYFGLNYEGLVGAIDMETGEEFIIGDDLTIEQTVVQNPRPPLAELCSMVGIDTVLPSDMIQKILNNALSSKKNLHFIPPYRAENTLKLCKWTSLSLEALKQYYSIDLIRSIIEQRSYKTADEISQISEAAEITYKMQFAAMAYSTPGIRESEVVAALEAIPKAMNVDLTFQTICTIHGEILHNQIYENVMKEGDLVLCDCGAKNPMQYCADITRTFPVSGRFSEIQKLIYQIVLNIHQKGIRAIRPGVKFQDIYLQVCTHLVESLKDIDLIRGDVDEAVSQGAHTLFLQRNMGHMIGLGGHDMQELGEDYVGYSDTVQRSHLPGLKYQRLGKELETGFVLTVEPGIYFNQRLIEYWKANSICKDFIRYEKLKHFFGINGIRLEDIVQVTETGHINLTDTLPKEIDLIEQACNE